MEVQLMTTRIVPTRMATSYHQTGYGANYCVECSDDDQDVRRKVKAALERGKLEIAEPAGGEICDGCGRPIREVPAYERTYLLAPEIEVNSMLEIPARSALEALLLLDKAIEQEG